MACMEAGMRGKPAKKKIIVAVSARLPYSSGLILGPLTQHIILTYPSLKDSTTSGAASQQTQPPR